MESSVDKNLKDKWDLSTHWVLALGDTIQLLQDGEPNKKENSKERKEWELEYELCRKMLIKMHYERIKLVMQMSKNKTYLD
jgi:hypothetical protein